MTVLEFREFTCPVCHNAFRTQICVVTNAYGGKRTDFYERASGVQPLRFCVSTCPECGFTGKEAWFTDTEELARVDVMCRAFVEARISPQVTKATPMEASLRYEFAALIAEHQQRDEEVVGSLWLRAAWCCLEEDDCEAERFYRLKAVAAYTKALENYGAVERDTRAALTYLVGELWRRIGHTKRATEWFAKVPGEVIDPITQKWVIDLAHQQSTSPREWLA